MLHISHFRLYFFPLSRLFSLKCPMKSNRHLFFFSDSNINLESENFRGKKYPTNRYSIYLMKINIRIDIQQPLTDKKISLIKNGKLFGCMMHNKIHMVQWALRNITNDNNNNNIRIIDESVSRIVFRIFVWMFSFFIR